MTSLNDLNDLLDQVEAWQRVPAENRKLLIELLKMELEGGPYGWLADRGHAGSTEKRLTELTENLRTLVVLLEALEP